MLFFFFSTFYSTADFRPRERIFTKKKSPTMREKKPHVRSLWRSIQEERKAGAISTACRYFFVIVSVPQTGPWLRWFALESHERDQGSDWVRIGYGVFSFFYIFAIVDRYVFPGGSENYHTLQPRFVDQHVNDVNEAENFKKEKQHSFDQPTTPGGNHPWDVSCSNGWVSRASVLLMYKTEN